jgi:hypothetical protein
MALKLLHGPIPMYPDPGDPETASSPAGLTEQTFWLDDVGLVGEPNPEFSPGNPWVCVNLDGMMSVRALRPSFNQDYDGIQYDYVTNKLVGLINVWTDGVFAVEPLNGSKLSNDTEGVYGLRLPDRVIKRTKNGTLQTAPFDTGVFADEYTFPAPDVPFSYNDNFMPGPGNTVYWYNGDESGVILHYDFQKKAEVQPQRRVSLGMQPTRVFYSRRFDIFIGFAPSSIGTPDVSDLYIWANEVVPDTLTTPIALTPITQGRVSTIQVRLLGDESTEIGGRLVDWSITAGNGELSSVQSKTDEFGVATVDYRAILSGGIDPTIVAEVTY